MATTRARGTALRAALLDVLGSGPTSRTALADAIGAPLSTVVDAVRVLVAEGAVEEVTGGPQRRPGRRPTLLQATVTTARTGVVIVAHGTLAVAVVDNRGRVSTQAHGTFDMHAPTGPVADACTLLAQAAAGISGEQGLERVVVGLPFPVLDGRRSWPRRARTTRNRQGELRPPWMSADLRQQFAERFQVPVLVENDANLAALGEARAGAGVGTDNMIGLTVASALGAGVVINQRLVRGAAGFAGELAHTQVVERGPLCSCGSRGCLATQNGWDEIIELLRPTFGDDVSLDDVVALAEDGDNDVIRTLTDHGQLIGKVLAPACALLNPQLISVDARLGAAAAPVIEGIRYSLLRQAPGVAVEFLRIERGQLPGTAEYVGAAALATQLSVSI